LAKLEQALLVLNGGEQIGTQELSQLFMTAFFTKRGDIIAYFPRMVAELEAGDASTYHVAMALLAGRLPPATEPKSAATPFEPLNTEVAAAASEPRDLAAGTSSAELQQARTLPERYLLLLDGAMARMKPDKRDGFGNSLIAYMDDEALRTRQGLIDITNNLAGPVEGAEMVSVVNEMSDAEVTQVFATVASDDFVQPLIMTEDFVSMAILCNDRIAYTSIAEYQELLRSFPAPQLGIDTSGLPFNIASCRVFGLGEPDGSAAPAAVTSDVPTLVFNGMLDASTPVEWASLAIPNLSDVRMETFPMAGHGATRYSQCAKDIAAAFFTYPERKYDDSCVAELQPPFVLPDDALPQIPAVKSE